ncbi:glycosyltransferase [uncultured Maribacter sp.]|uniref:glycosyltransferase n=1 Tax=uncultured Maribacter sp. TaxID=431308 RepID=UPI00262D4B09|nr:glycosyltransferase [uncultured Maribacter sp.]
MRITFVLDTFGGGGKERRCLQLIQGLNKEGYSNIQVIIINNDIAYNELYDTNIELHIIDRKNKGLNYLKTFLIVNKLFKKFNPDIVQVWGVFSTLFTNPIRCFRRFKYIGSYVANCNKPEKYSVEKLTILFNIWLANFIIGNSEAGIKAYGVPQKKAKVIYNGFNNERLKTTNHSKKELKKQLNLNSNFIVSMIARLDDNKDHETYIDAAKSIIKKRKDILFLIIGTGPNSIKLQTKIEQKDKAFINFLGFRSDIENLLRITDVSVLCTNPNNHKEGVSNAIMESMAFGVPVIATDDGGTPEIINTGSNGFLIKPHKSNELKDKILQVLKDENLHKTFSEEAKKTIETKFNLDRMTAQYIELYNLLLKK